MTLSGTVKKGGNPISGPLIYLKSDVAGAPTDAEFTALLVQNVADGLMTWNTVEKVMYMRTGGVHKPIYPAINTKAGVPVDADFGSPADGMMVLNTLDNSINARSNALWTPYAKRRLVLPSYIIWDDGTNYHGDSLIQTPDATPGTDFGAVFNACNAQLPTGTTPVLTPQGGTILIRKSIRTYKYSTTPLTQLSNLAVIGEGPSTVLEPSAAVNGLTFQVPTGNRLHNPVISNLGFIDTTGSGVGKKHVVFDTLTNPGNNGYIHDGLVEKIWWYGNPNATQQSNSTGQLIGGLAAGPNNGLVGCHFSHIYVPQYFNYPSVQGLIGDSVISLPIVIDCHFTDIIAFIHQTFSANPHFDFNAALASPAAAGYGSGSFFARIKFVTDVNTAVPAFHFKGGGDFWIEDLTAEVGTLFTGSVGMFFEGASTPDTRIRRVRFYKMDVGLKFGADATHVGDAFFGDVYGHQFDITGCNIGIQSVSGDASLKTIYGGHVTSNNTADLSPNPLTGARFYNVKIGGVFDQGYLITTPAVPATGVDQQNTTGFPIVVYITGIGTNITAVGITDSNGTLTTYATNEASFNIGQSFILPQLAKIRLTYTGAPTWKWYGV